MAESTLDDLSQLRAEMDRLQREVARLRALMGTPANSGEGRNQPLDPTEEPPGVGVCSRRQGQPPSGPPSSA